MSQETVSTHFFLSLVIKKPSLAKPQMKPAQKKLLAKKKSGTQKSVIPARQDTQNNQLANTVEAYLIPYSGLQVHLQNRNRIINN